jgi:hypothetical protein
VPVLRRWQIWRSRPGTEDFGRFHHENSGIKYDVYRFYIIHDTSGYYEESSKTSIPTGCLILFDTLKDDKNGISLGSQAHLGLKNAESQGVIAKKWG